MVSLWLLVSYILAYYKEFKTKTRYASYDPIASVCFYVVSRELICVYNFHSNNQLHPEPFVHHCVLSVSGLSGLDLVMYLNVERVTLLNRFTAVSTIHNSNCSDMPSNEDLNRGFWCEK